MRTLFMAFVFALTAVLNSQCEVTFLLAPERVFDAEDGKTHAGWVVLVSSNKIAAVGAPDQVKVP